MQQQDDPVLRLPIMEAELALSTEDATKQQELREAIGDAKTAAEFGVRRVQHSFYEAFSSQDITLMRQVWSTKDDIRCVHPGMECLIGQQEVMQSWRDMFGVSDGFKISPSRVQIDVTGTTALCTCIEKTHTGGQLECVNVYRREDGDWKMILHMAAPNVMANRGAT
eukprot:CAMPEP_0194032066 /NCGR_PEP_ID=MMETSP0009_2-20130614/5093_1 /TAXON_ID=210454 /ORGANISM="Grammatophora oceanica, Strain CCMP 410" /LENGTH=166 /DNA_ID=CAMNT_0038672393 /DNA_START=201 /DNA_END=698 /DNA_ORIENTATION=+